VLGRVLVPMSDHRGSKEYRREVAQSLVEKFWWESRHDDRR
jgi:xanthine dehydrogenase iron-sulfur cluster and FAD-binding subunit A